MELTQRDFEERKARVDDGTASDEDRRLVKQYEAEGYAVKSEQTVSTETPAVTGATSKANTGVSKGDQKNAKG